MNNPPRLLDTRKGQLTERLLRAGVSEKPPRRSLQRAFAAAAAASSATTASAASVAAAGIGKTVMVWLAVGSLCGVAVGTAASTLQTPRAESSSGRVAPISQARVPATANALASPATAPAAAFSKEPALALQPSPPAVPARAASTVAPPRRATRESAAIPAMQRAPSAQEFNQELALIDDAQRRLSNGDPRGTLAALARYRNEFPTGHFTPEALALEVQAEIARGDRSAAERDGQRFLANYPNHPLAVRVRRALQR